MNQWIGNNSETGTIQHIINMKKKKKMPKQKARRNNLFISHSVWGKHHLNSNASNLLLLINLFINYWIHFANTTVSENHEWNSIDVNLIVSRFGNDFIKLSGKSVSFFCCIVVILKPQESLTVFMTSLTLFFLAIVFIACRCYSRLLRCKSIHILL